MNPLQRLNFFTIIGKGIQGASRATGFAEYFEAKKGIGKISLRLEGLGLKIVSPLQISVLPKQYLEKQQDIFDVKSKEQQATSEEKKKKAVPSPSTA